MRLRNQLAIVVSLVTFVFLCWTAVVAQQTYPSTGQEAFAPAANAFPVSTPILLDQLTGQDSEMSPEHWGSTANLEGENTYLSSQTAQPWDGQIESHPWLQQDEMAGFDPSNFPELESGAFSVSSEPDKNSGVPLPPSAANSDDIPLPPSSIMAPPTNSDPLLYPKSGENAVPPVSTDPVFNSEPSLTNDASSLIREPAFNNDPPFNAQPEFSPDPSFEVESPVTSPSSLPSEPAAEFGQPEDLPPLPALPSSERSNDFKPHKVTPKTVDYPDGEYRSEIPSSPVEGAVNTDVNATDAPNATRVPLATPGIPDLNGGPTSSTYEKINTRRNGFSRRDGRLFGRNAEPDVSNSNPAFNEQSVGVAPQRYPLPNLYGSESTVQTQVAPSRFMPSAVAVEPRGGTSIKQPFTQPNFRPDLGFRSQNQVVRGAIPQDYGQNFGYEEEHYPPMKEILATGRYFGSIEADLLKPHFQGNTSIAQSNGFAGAFDWNYAGAPKLRFGFESQLGPGGELIYSQYHQNSNPAIFTSDGVVSGTTSVYMAGHEAWSRLTAANAGETLFAVHSLEIQQFSACMFKDLNFRRAKLNGIFGLQYVGVNQELSAVLLDGGGTEIGSLSQRTNLDAFGPRVGFEYYRKIGHTGLVLVNHFGGSLLFGNADQFVENTSTNVFSISGADEFLTILDLGFGIQKHRRIGENRSIYWKIGYVGQTWLGGGNASDPQEDFGVRGYSFTLGFNR